MLDWAYALPCLALGVLLQPKGVRPSRAFAWGALASCLVALAYVWHVLPDYSSGDPPRREGPVRSPGQRVRNVWAVRDIPVE